MIRSAGLLLSLFVSASLSAVEGDAIGKWTHDLSFLRNELPKRHRNFFHDTSPKDFDDGIARIEADLPRLNENEIIVRIAQTVKRAVGDRDGHSGVMLRPPSAPFLGVPVNFFRDADGLYIRAAARDYADLVGGRVVAIGGAPADVAWKAVWTLAAGDNDKSREASGEALLSMPGLLRATRTIGGSANEPVEISVLLADGRRVTRSVATVEKLDSVAEWVDVRRLGAVPLYLRHVNPNPFMWFAPSKALWFEYLEPQKALYVHYGAVADSPDETVAAFFARVFAFADSNAVDKFIVDLRHNGGGNNFLNRPFLHGMIKRDATIGRRGVFFVLIGRHTFSAAQNIVTQLEAHTNVIFVGEPTGGSPNHFGDATRVRLPNSGLVIRASTLWWQDAHPNDERLWIAPQIAADPSIVTDRAGRDVVLDAALAYKPEPPIAEVLRGVLAEGKAAVASAYAKWRSAPHRKYVSAERDVNTLAVSLFGEDRNRGVTMFEINAEAYPSSWRAQESLGRAYVAVGRKDDAIAAFKRAVALSDKALIAKEQLAVLTAPAK